MGLPPFQEFLDANRSTVYRFLLVAVGSTEADDVFQETFIAALRAYPRLHHGESLDRWVLRIASRKALDHHRSTGRRAVPTDVLSDRPTDAPAEPDEELWKAVRDLPPRQRVALVHRHVLDRPYAEIAHFMGSSEQTARANVSHGIRRLREVLT